MGNTYTVGGRTWCMSSGTYPSAKDQRESDRTITCGECGRGYVAVRKRGGTIAHHSPPDRPVRAARAKESK